MFKEIAIMLDKIDYPDNNYWINDLRVTEPIRDNLTSESKKENYINKLLNIKNLDNILKEWLILKGYNIENNDLMELLLENIDNQIIISLIYLRFYLDNKRKNVRQTIIKEILLDSEEQKMVEELGHEYYIALFTLYHHYEELLYYLVLDKAERVSYGQYSLVPDTDNEKEYDKVLGIINNELNIEPLLDKNFVQNNLNQFELQLSDGKRSKVLLIQKDKESLKLYIQRDVGTRSIHEQTRTIIGEGTDIFIIEFFDKGRLINERSLEDFGQRIAAFLVKNIIKQEVCYEEFRDNFSIDKLKNFFYVLLNKEDTNIRIRTLNMDNFPLKNRPIFNLKLKNKDLDLADSIKDLENIGYKLLTEKSFINEILSIDLNFRINENDDFNVIPIYPDIHEDSVVLFFSNGYISTYKSNYFVEHMERKYDIYVIPRRS